MSDWLSPGFLNGLADTANALEWWNPLGLLPHFEKTATTPRVVWSNPLDTLSHIPQKVGEVGADVALGVIKPFVPYLVVGGLGLLGYAYLEGGR